MTSVRAQLFHNMLPQKRSLLWDGDSPIWKKGLWHKINIPAVLHNQRVELYASEWYPKGPEMLYVNTLLFNCRSCHWRVKKVKKCSSFTEAEARTTMREQEFSSLFTWDCVGVGLGRDEKWNNCFKCYSMLAVAPPLLPGLEVQVSFTLKFSPPAKCIWKTPDTVPQFNPFSCADASLCGPIN